MPQEKSAGAIIYRLENGKPHYLLLYYASGHWEFAKGHIEKGESFKKTIRREVQEETGIKDIRFVPGFKHYAKYFFKRSYGLTNREKKNAPWVFKLVLFLLAETKTKKVKISKEHLGFVWLSYKQALKKATYKNAKELIKKANNFIMKHET